MTFDPSSDHDQILDAPWAEYLAVQPTRDADDKIVAVLTFRLSPAVSFAAKNYCLTQLHAIRLRDDLATLTFSFVVASISPGRCRERKPFLDSSEQRES